MNVRTVNFTFIIFLLLNLFALFSLAQSKCNLQFSIYEFKGDVTSEQFPVSNSIVNMVNNKTKQSLKIVSNNDLAEFKGVPEGEYELSFSKPGFQTTLNQYGVYCGLVPPPEFVKEIMFLWKGDSKETKKYWGYDSNGEKSSVSYGVKTVVGDNEPPSKSEIDNSSIINGKAINLVRPEYPKAASAVRAKGKVEVQVTINELGYVVSAKAVSGHPLLQPAAVDAASKSRFGMTLLSGMPVKVTGIIVYNFG